MLNRSQQATYVVSSFLRSLCDYLRGPSDDFAKYLINRGTVSCLPEELSEKKRERFRISEPFTCELGEQPCRFAKYDPDTGKWSLDYMSGAEGNCMCDIGPQILDRFYSVKYQQGVEIPGFLRTSEGERIKRLIDEDPCPLRKREIKSKIKERFDASV